MDDKVANGCRCMGPNIFDENSCYFPGVGGFYVEELDQPKPVEPAELGDTPPAPEIPPPPPQPGEGAGTLELTQYLESLRIYQEETDEIREDYEAQIEAHQAKAEVYQTEIRSYQEDLLEWETERNSAVGKAEGVMGSIRDEFGWTFVAKDDTADFISAIMVTGFAQVVISVVFFGMILVFIKRKDKV